MGTAACWFEELRRIGAVIQVGEVPPAEGLWMSSPSDPEPTSAEHAVFVDGLANRLHAFLDARGVPRAAYIRGDFFGTREEELHAYGERFATSPDAVAGAVRLVQGWLREHPRWRVVLPLDEGPDSAIVIYPGRVFFGASQLDDAELDELLRRYVEFETKANGAPGGEAG